MLRNLSRAQSNFLSITKFVSWLLNFDREPTVIELPVNQSGDITDKRFPSSFKVIDGGKGEYSISRYSI